MASNRSLARFKNSLRDFLINALVDRYGDATYYANKFHNLKVYIDPRRTYEPHFYVSVGISEACYSLSSGKPLTGSIGDEDNYIKRWSERTNINKELKKQWQLVKDAVEAEDSEDLRKSLDEDTQRRTNRANALQVDMTGTGLNRAKKLELDRKQQELLKSLEDEQEQEQEQN